jgi:hypothetical protein
MNLGRAVEGLTPDKGEVGGSSPPRPTIQIRESRLPNEQRTAEVAKHSAEDLPNQARYPDQLGRHGSQFIDEIRYRRGIRLPARGTDGFLPTTTPADQKSSMGAAWPETEASRASLVTNGAPSFSASTM